MIGVDLVFIPEFQKQLNIGGQTFLQRAFSASELGNQKTEHLAGLWAAKEAVIKAADSAPGKMSDIVISHNASQKPFAKIGSQKFALSISHHGEYAVAVAYRTGL
jgi:phosphopantetheine--protein transferase-like protein